MSRVRPDILLSAKKSQCDFRVCYKMARGRARIKSRSQRNAFKASVLKIVEKFTRYYNLSLRRAWGGEAILYSWDRLIAAWALRVRMPSMGTRDRTRVTPKPRLICGPLKRQYPIC